MGRCRSCKAPVRWVTMPSGKPMICDADPVQTIRLDEAVIVTGPQNQGFAIQKTQAIQILRPHWATCPDADDWRQTRHESTIDAAVAGGRS